MFCYDIESMGIESTSVILSAALVYVDHTRNDNTWESIYENTLFLKFSVRDQIENYGRTIDKRTVAWWNKQCSLAKETSFLPKKGDLLAKDAVACFRNYINSQTKRPKEEIVWVRGSLDQTCTDSLFLAMEEELLFPYSNYRDVRTALDFIATNTKHGYCEISDEYPGIWDRNVVVKHRPQDDVVLDSLMILYPS